MQWLAHLSRAVVAVVKDSLWAAEVLMAGVLTGTMLTGPGECSGWSVEEGLREAGGVSNGDLLVGVRPPLEPAGPSLILDSVSCGHTIVSLADTKDAVWSSACLTALKLTMSGGTSPEDVDDRR